MKISQITGFSTNKTNKNNKPQNGMASKPTFEGHKLLEVFDVPHYQSLKGYIYELTNKQKVIIIPKKGAGATSVNTVVKTGALNEEDKFRGISHFMEHLAFDGSKGLKAGGFDKIADSKGANINAHTGTELTAYFFQVNGAKTKDYEELIAAHAKMIKYPKVGEAQFKKEQEVVIKEINQSQDRPSSKAYFDTLKNLFGINSASDHMVLGSEENIRNATFKDVLNYHKNSYTPDNMETYVVGDVSHKKMIDIIDKNFDTPDFRPAKKPILSEKISPIEKTKIEITQSPKVNISDLTIGFIGPENLNQKESSALDVLTKILTLNKSTRLNKNLSELNTEGDMGLYPVASNKKFPQAIFFDTKVDVGSEQKALDAISKSIKEIKTNPITQDELETAKRLILNTLNKASEESESLTSVMENAINVGGIDVYKNQIKNIKDVTVEDLNQVAEKYLNTQKAAVTILQPEGVQNGNITFTGKSIINTKFLKKMVLPNNLELVLNDNPNTIRTAMNINIKSPAERKPGVSEVLAQMLNNSNAVHNEEEFSNLKSKNAVDFAIAPSGKGLMASLGCLKESLSTGLDILKEALTSPKLDEKNFLKAKDEISFALKGATISANDRLMETVYGKTTTGESARVLKQEIDNVTLDDVKKYYADIMANSEAKSSITGPISSVEGLKETIAEKLGNLGTSFKTNINKKITVDDIKEPIVLVQAQKGLSQSTVLQFFHINSTKIEDVAAFRVMNTILGGGLSARLFKDLREKQELAYQVGSRFSSTSNFSNLQFIIKTDIKKGEAFTDNIEKSLTGFEKHINLLKKAPVTEIELANAKKSLRTAYSMQAESAGGQNDIITGGMVRDKADYNNKLMDAIDKVTPEDIQRVANEQLSKPSAISILTTEEAAAKTQKFLEGKGKYKFFADEK